MVVALRILGQTETASLGGKAAYNQPLLTLPRREPLWRHCGNVDVDVDDDSIKAPVGRWQKGKDLHWYTRDKKFDADVEAMKEERQRIKEEEEQAMREALGLAPKRASKSQGNRLDKHEFAELVKRGSTAEDLGAGHAEAAQVHGLGFSRGARPMEESSLPTSMKPELVEKLKVAMPTTSARNDDQEESEDESVRKKRKREEKKREMHEQREKRHSRDSDDRRSKHKKDKERKRHDSD